jgi:hypothetical protein
VTSPHLYTSYQNPILDGPGTVTSFVSHLNFIPSFGSSYSNCFGLSVSRVGKIFCFLYKITSIYHRLVTELASEKLFIKISPSEQRSHSFLTVVSNSRCELQESPSFSDVFKVGYEEKE